MTRTVVDCSVAAALFLPDEHSAKAQALITGCLNNGGVLVPHLWWLEMANVLTLAVRRKRISETEALSAFSLLSKLDIHTDRTTGSEYALALHRLAVHHGLTAYDAAYLELAMRHKCKLASFDAALLKEALKTGIHQPA